ncbi:hypothetical protein PENTCL1PPCAC_22115, partial [Pristionchus entomophagus]
AFFAALHLVRSDSFSSCPNGFDLVRDGECRGRVTNLLTTFGQAISQVIDMCGSIQAQPVTIHNEEHQAYWKVRAPDSNSNYLILG